MSFKHHKTLTKEKWGQMPFSRQLLMIGAELQRANSWIEKNDSVEVLSCYERALELLSLTIEVTAMPFRIRELLRFQEELAARYASGYLSRQENEKLLQVLLSLSSESYNVLH